MEWKIVNHFYDVEEGKEYIWDEMSPEKQREASDKIHRRLAEAFGLRIKEKKAR